MSLIDVSNRTEIITESAEDQKYLYRVTGKKPKLLEDFTVKSFSEVL